MIKSIFLMISLLFAGLLSHATLPPCLDKSGSHIPINNEEIINWKKTTQPQFKDRGHAKGTLLKVYNDKTDHDHFQIQIGPESNDVVEIIYNAEFGTLPELKSNMQIEVCGDYITTKKSGYGASPDGAIIHWVHMSNSGNHPSGYVTIDGIVY
ncbi:MAG: hypothetical protein ACK41T_10240 [Pseudobdellovibrio sp.]